MSTKKQKLLLKLFFIVKACASSTYSLSRASVVACFRGKIGRLSAWGIFFKKALSFETSKIVNTEKAIADTRSMNSQRIKINVYGIGCAALNIPQKKMNATKVKA